MLVKQNKFTRFISKLTSGEWFQSNKAQGFLSKWSYLNIPLDVFIKSVCDKSIDPDIKEQFFDSIKDKQYKYIQKLTKEINILEIKYNCIQTSVMYLEKNPGDIEVLAVIKTFILINATDSIGVILSRGKRFLTEADTKREELKRITAGIDGKEPDEKYFNQLTISVGQHMGYHINRKETLANEFADMVNNLIETNEAKIVHMNGKRPR